MTEILVTGARGYIGGRLVESLARDGARVRAGTRKASAAGEIETNFDDDSSLVEACRGCETVIHLASLNEIDCAVDPEAATLVNTIYTQRLARAAEIAGISRFIYFSTVHVYGSPLTGRLTEDSPARPAHPYSISHKAAEDYLAFGAAKSSMSTTILRLTNSFGFPAMREINRWTLVANDAARQLAENGRVVLRTPGTQLRDFVALPDVCRAVTMLASREPNAGSCDVFNLGNGRSMVIIDLVRDVVEAYESVTGRKAEIVKPDGPAIPGGDLQVDIGKLSALGYLPCADSGDELRELVRRCLAWFGPARE